jgi:hypothetical protein
MQSWCDSLVPTVIFGITRKGGCRVVGSGVVLVLGEPERDREM